MDSSDSGGAQRLSYKFQRLRERLRTAITSGELAGKLPGERELARRFGVNAKTLSKALTDLAAEGLLERNIGRGTYVRGSVPAEEAGGGRWLVVCRAAHAGSAVVQELVRLNPQAQITTDVTNTRPSFINQFDAVALMDEVPDAWVRDLCVRGVPVVAVDFEPRTFSVHAVLVDRDAAVMTVARELLLAGHRQVVAVEGQGRTRLAEMLRTAAARWNPEATVDACYASEVVAAASGAGATAFVCDSPESARVVSANLENAGVRVPEEASIVAVGVSAVGNPPANGCYVDAAEIARTVAGLLGEERGRSPVRLYLAGMVVRRGTIAPVRQLITEDHDQVTQSLRLSGIAV